MRPILIALLLLAAAPVAAAAQQHPVPDPRQLPEMRKPVLIPESGSRASQAVVGAMEGALEGFVNEDIAREAAPGCRLGVVTRDGPVRGVVAGVLSGGLRGFLGLRRSRGRVRTDTPNDRERPAMPNPVVGEARCGEATGRGPMPAVATR